MTSPASLQRCSSDTGDESLEHPAAKQPQRQQMPRQLGLPRLGPLLLLRPWPHERSFWTSPLYTRVAHDIDVLNLTLRCMEVYFALFRSWVHVEDDALLVIQGVLCNTVMLIALHLALRILMPAVYSRWRWLLVIHMRLYNLLSGIAILRELRGLIVRAPPSSSPLLDYLIGLPTEPLPCLATARALAMALLTFRALGQSLPPLVPLPLHAALQVAFFLAVVRYMSGPVATHFTHPAHTPHVQQLCRIVAAWAAPSTTPPFLPAAPLHSVCGTPQSAWVLSLFLPLFGGVALPLYIAYISERALKRRFLATAPLPGPAPSPPSTPTTSAGAHPFDAPPEAPSPLSSPASPIPSIPRTEPLPPHPPLSAGRSAPSCVLAAAVRCAAHALSLWLLATLSWAASVACARVVARTIAKPLRVDAQHQHWYWQLLCDQDGPCCPAP